MKKRIPFITLVISALLFTTLASAQPEPMEFKTVDNFFLKNDVRLAAGVNCMVFTNAAQFNKTFAAAKTATNTVATPNFTTQRVAAIAIPPSYRKTQLIVDKVEMSGSFVYVHFREVLGENQTFTSTPLTIISFDRASFIKVIAFYIDKKLVKSFPVK